PRWVIPSGYPAGDWGSLRVALNEELVVIGVAAESASGEDPTDTSSPASGAVYVYERSHLHVPIQRIKAPRVESGALFGSCVALSGGRLAVGAANEDNPGAPDSGAAYVYEWQNGRFDLAGVKRVVPDVIHATDQFGTALDLEEDLLVVGAIGESSAS